ncbi:sensor histidine kinase [Novispirillum sp. DQ9]|uniref:sensor histidine kinase n=1 Tax=Novispirillum sp. DQ9 TaxID=3398612 RepID=UPI003C7A1965
MRGSVNVRALRWALLGYAVGGVFVVALVTAVLTYLPLSERLRTAAADGILDIARTSADAIGHIVDGRHKVARQISSRTSARTYLEQYNSGLLTLDDYSHKVMPILGDAILSTADITGITRVAPDGTSVGVGETFAPAQWPPDHATVDRVTAHGPLDTPYGQRVLLASPVVSHDGTRAGTDIIGLDLAPVAQRVALHKAEGGGSTRVYLLFERAGEKLLFLADGTVERLTDQAHLPVSRVLAVTSRRGEVIEAGDHITAVVPAPVNNWTMVVSKRRDEVFAGLNHDLILIAGVVLGLAAAGTAGIYVLLRPVTGKLMIHTDTLENEVTRATADLNGAMLNLAAAKAQAEQERDRAQAAFDELSRTQEILVESEKLASLGSLVAGVAHEINTPVGIVVTSASYLAKETDALRRLYDAEDLGTQDMEDYMAAASEAVHLIQANATRAADLIQSFKQVAVDRTAGELREINLKDYIGEILTSLRPQLKKLPVEVRVDAPETLDLVTSPGSLSQVLTNLVMNSLTHGFDEAGGIISITVADYGDTVEIAYADNGKGIAPEHRGKVFDPFFTTRRNAGGSGLGMNIVYNIVTRTLGGRVSLDGTVATGARFVIRFPKVVKDAVSILHA